MVRPSGISAHSPLTAVTFELGAQAIADAILRGNLTPTGDVKAGHTHDALASAQLRVCADALKRAVDGMGDNAADANYEYVADQLERVQESAGRAILAAVNAQRAKIIASYEVDDEAPTMTRCEDAFAGWTPPTKGGAA